LLDDQAQPEAHGMSTHVRIYVLSQQVRRLNGGCMLDRRGKYGSVRADKPAEKHCSLICCERKILFRLKKTS
jgi:hypothetical protein